MSEKTGVLISFEGSEGCGKSTQIGLLRQRLEEMGRRVEVLREPGGTAVGEAIRHLLQHAPEGAGMTDEAELLLFAASRAQLVRERVQPLLAVGVVVVLDRFLDSTTVYQGIARGLPVESVAAINAFAVGGTLPRATFLLDMAAEQAHARISQTGRELDRIESQPMAFFQRVRDGYLQVAAGSGGRVRVLEATQPAAVIHEQVWGAVAKLID